MTKTSIFSFILLLSCTFLRSETITTVFKDKSHDALPTTFLTEIDGEITLTGKITTSNGVSVRNVKLTLKKGNTIISTLITDGAYTFANLDANETYTIELENMTDPYNGVTTFDIARIAKSILNIEPLNSNYSIMAANVSEVDNDNSVVDVMDLILIREFILRKIPALPGNTWNFVPSNYEFTTVAPNFPKPQPMSQSFTIKTASSPIEFNFVGIKEGDVNGTTR
jgi:hypothetical protein